GCRRKRRAKASRRYQSCAHTVPWLAAIQRPETTRNWTRTDPELEVAAVRDRACGVRTSRRCESRTHAVAHPGARKWCCHAVAVEHVWVDANLLGDVLDDSLGHVGDVSQRAAWEPVESKMHREAHAILRSPVVIDDAQITLEQRAEATEVAFREIRRH